MQAVVYLQEIRLVIIKREQENALDKFQNSYEFQ